MLPPAHKARVTVLGGVGLGIYVKKDEDEESWKAVVEW